jgi:predicted nucleotidyltransferase
MSHTHSFSPAQLAVLRQLAALWTDVPFVLIGASALNCHWRLTYDLDIVISVGLGDLARGVGLERQPGWRRSSSAHRWIAPSAIQVDLLPADKALLRQGYVDWPDGWRMSLLGLRHAFGQGRPVTLAEDLEVSIAPAHVVVLLKIAAYLDRPFERRRDLTDLAHLLDNYVADDDLRRWDESVLDAELDYEQTAAYLLGRDLGGIVDQAERAAVAAFMRRVLDGDDLAATQAEMTRLGPPSWRGRPDELLGRVTALLKGLAR